MEPRRLLKNSISEFITVTILFALLNSQNVAAKYVPSVPAIDAVAERPPYNHTVTLDKRYRPEVEWYLKSDSQGMRFVVNKNSSEFRIAVHLKDCGYNSKDTTVKLWTGKEEFVWRCPSQKDFQEDSESQGLHRGIHTRKNGEDVLEVVNGLEDVIITPNFIERTFYENASKNNFSDKWTYNHIKATIIISIYKDVNKNNACGPQFFNCYAELCPSRCCSDHDSGSGGTTSRSGDSLLKYLSSEAGKSRCIPSILKCNDNPNCGTLIRNADEVGETCKADLECGGCQMCLSWDYVLTSLAIAVLFIITPTAIVFALFHRRNVALERQRLIRLAHQRMADLRGEFTRESPINDLPPTYDEVCDIKIPPPCFCQAIAMEMGMDAMEFQQIVQNRSNSSENCCDNSSGGEGGETEVEMTARSSNGNNNDERARDSQNNVGVVAQNVGFKCSCQSVDQSQSQNQSEDSPPGYDVLNNTTSTTTTNGADNHEVINGTPEAIEIEGDDKSTNL